ncbi:efflux RND transporter periplasmic adaptor subunit [uncultured Desulfuromusa sp.]|uniref:efflux RND transporter periplasmic adaptor subunit n=1 Tax=uncultured Desulfuromusa sp. TaxID=219183 RepID=UPI002AA661B5|nr:efflux RND transporter periplasmic adaptor subunit [uncultured Desulfuromusa sp.]
MKKKILTPVVIIVVIASVAWGTWEWLGSQKDPGSALTLYGNIEIRDARLAFTEQEIVSEVTVNEGDTVVAGQVLARLKSQRLHDQLKEAQAQLEAQSQIVHRLVNGTRAQEIRQFRAELEAAGVRLKNAEKNARRLESTAASGASSQQVLDDAHAAVEIERAQLNVRRQAYNLAVEGPRSEDIAEARARLEANRAHLAYLNTRLEETVLKSPSAGIIQSRILEPGEMAGPTRPAFVLALTDPKWVRAYVSEPDLGRVKEGVNTKVSSDSWPDKKFSGQVGFISSIAEFTPKSVETTDLRTKLVYEVRIWVDDPNNQLRLGMPVTVEFETETATPASRLDSTRKTAAH